MRQLGQRIILTVGSMLVALPVAVVATILLTPFWGWIESTFGLESLGHSGPSDWCFVAVYCLLLLAGGGALVARWRTPR